MTINGSVPGPLVRLQEGERVTLRVTNELDEDARAGLRAALLREFPRLGVMRLSRCEKGSDVLELGIHRQALVHGLGCRRTGLRRLSEAQSAKTPHEQIASGRDRQDLQHGLPLGAMASGAPFVTPAT